ncbi:nucleotidyltransferase substrate binding protein [Cytophagales bacterium LB-30]|uniref:Nucleotidyltransferase substrate binding protein n=1 Tax=Shiella aurantiaca TaxID=3058365 RepID=A0ABT8F4I2_9BACT|nr:nucleotidyltransferase substrate binding protein [Shiella aurantiaca]MDN4165179.1 nucleotidyltransferase substrate binding protein [Shiella aurantiaca]
MTNQDIRWEQRFSNYNKALKKLEDGVEYIHQNILDEEGEGLKEEEIEQVLSDLIKQGLIQSFEFTHELAWNVIKDYAAFQGNPEIRESRDAIREGFAMGLLSNADVWMEMIGSRNKTSHTYDEDTADEIYTKIIYQYLPAFIAFKKKMEGLRSGKQGDLF